MSPGVGYARCIRSFIHGVKLSGSNREILPNTRKLLAIFAVPTVREIRVIRGSIVRAHYYSKSYTTTRLQTRLNTFSTNSMCIGWAW